MNERRGVKGMYYLVTDVNQYIEHDSPICGYAIRDDGYIAVALTNGRVLIFNENAKYQTSIYFEPQTSAYEVKWEDKNIEIYIHRGEKLLKYDMQGNCINKEEGIDLDTNSRQLHTQICGKDYYLKYSLGTLTLPGAGDYNTLIMEENNKSTIVYQYEPLALRTIKQFVVFFLVIAFFIAIGVMLYKSIKKRKINNM